MAYDNLYDLIEKLETQNELLRIKEYVSTELEATEIVDRVIKSSNKAILFENNGCEFPLLLNLFGSENRIKIIFNISNLNEISERIEKIFSKLTKPKDNLIQKFALLPTLKKISSFMPNKSSGRAKCQEEMMFEPDLDKLPILKCWPFDGGKFITFPMVITKNPETNIQNIGMYRMQVIDKKTTAMHWHLHKDGAKHFDLYKEKGQLMPVSVAIGGDPIITYCATAPLPENIDEFMFAGFLRQEKVRLIKSKTNDIYVPADADFILEGYIDTNEDFILEGPFGDHTGYYSLADYYPKFHLTCITYRKDAIYPSTIVGVPPKEDKWLGIATERFFLKPMQIAINQDIIDIKLPYQGGFHNLAIVKIKNRFVGNAYTIINSLWGAGQMAFNKIMIVVNQNIDLNNHLEIINQISKVDLDNDILISQGIADVLDHSGRKFAFSGKIAIDATNSKDILNNFKFNETEFSKKYQNINFNDEFVREYGMLFISINKKEININVMLESFFDDKIIENIKFLFIFDSCVNLFDYNILLWQFSGNIDCNYDIKIVDSQSNKTLIIDATAKNIDDNFNRDWPNVIVMDTKTIEMVDVKWDKYNIGEFVKSPSLELSKMVNNEGAVAIMKK